MPSSSIPPSSASPSPSRNTDQLLDQDVNFLFRSPILLKIHAAIIHCPSGKSRRPAAKTVERTHKIRWITPSAISNAATLAIWMHSVDIQLVETPTITHPRGLLLHVLAQRPFPRRPHSQRTAKEIVVTGARPPHQPAITRRPTLTPANNARAPPPVCPRPRRPGSKDFSDKAVDRICTQPRENGAQRCFLNSDSDSISGRPVSKPAKTFNNSTLAHFNYNFGNSPRVLPRKPSYQSLYTVSYQELSGAQSANSSVCGQFVPASWIILFVDFWMSLEEQFPNFWASCEQIFWVPVSEASGISHPIIALARFVPLKASGA
ncbi:hypothetical protein C8J57DRAFT_1240928 [Mycena rebaudengoi]|nr:hypothetical protein C8J57DRAFT_1240928 [Mycena rebaudengoi]